MTWPINCSILKDTQCPLKWGDNVATHATYSSEALGHDLVGFIIGLNFFLRNSSVTDHNGKWKACKEVDTSPIEYIKPDPSKGRRDKEILQRSDSIKASIDQRKDKGKEIKLPRRRRDRTTNNDKSKKSVFLKRHAKSQKVKYKAVRQN